MGKNAPRLPFAAMPQIQQGIQHDLEKVTFAYRKNKNRKKIMKPIFFLSTCSGNTIHTL